MTTSEKKVYPKKPKNKLLKSNMLYRRKNKPPFGGIRNHLICLNKILRYPFENDHSFYCIDPHFADEIIENLKVFGYESTYDSETQLLKILFTKTIPINTFDIRYNQFYGCISPLPTMLELRNRNANIDDERLEESSPSGEDMKKFHLDCIKKVLKCESSKIIKYYIPHFGLIDDILKTLIEYQYTINFEKNILTINL